MWSLDQIQYYLLPLPFDHDCTRVNTPVWGLTLLTHGLFVADEWPTHQITCRRERCNLLAHTSLYSIVMWVILYTAWKPSQTTSHPTLYSLLGYLYLYKYENVCTSVCLFVQLFILDCITCGSLVDGLVSDSLSN